MPRLGPVSGAGSPGPSPSEAREAVRRELLDPRYRDRDQVTRLLDWLRGLLEQGLVAVGDASAASTWVATVLLLALALALLLLASRARRTARSRPRPGDVLGALGPDADALRARAERLHAEGRHDEALLEAFRALARREVERGRLVEDPGATAREVAASLDDDRVRRAAELFDAVLYGGSGATAEQAADVLALDAAAGRR